MRPYMDTTAVDEDSNGAQAQEKSGGDAEKDSEASEGGSTVDEVSGSGTGTSVDATAATDDGDYVYDLVGVVIHSGHAEGGHYWSLVRDRFVSSSSSTGSSGRWLQFNDQRVSSFSINDLASEAFGGMEDITVDVTAKKDKNGPQTEQVRVEKQRSAYMLVYAKRQRVPAEVSLHVHQEEKEHVTGLQRSQSAVAFPSAIPVSSLPTYLHDMHAGLLRSNLQLLRDHLSFDPPYAVFLLRCHLHAYDMFQRSDLYPPHGQPASPSLPLQIVQSLALYTLTVATRAKHTKRLEQFVGLLASMVAIHVPACVWLLDRLAGDSVLLRQLLLGGSGSNRRLIVHLLEIAVSKLISFELDPEYTEKLLLPPIVDREKERLAAEGDWDVSTISAPASAALPASAPSSAVSSPATSATNSPALPPQPTPPPVPPRTLSQSSSPASTPPPVPPRSLPSVDAGLAPDGMFKVKGQVSLSSPLTALNGIGSATAKALANAGVNTLQLLAAVRDRSKKEYSMLMSSTKLSPKQMTDAVDKARAACSFVKMIGGDEPKATTATVPATGTVAAMPVSGITAEVVNEAVQNGSAEPKLLKRTKDFVGLTDYAVIPRFITACLGLLRAITASGSVDSAHSQRDSLELVDLLGRFARKSRMCVRLLVDNGALDALIALYLGHTAQGEQKGSREPSHWDDSESTEAGVEGSSHLRHDSISADTSTLSLNDVQVPPLPPLPGLVATTSAASGTLPSPTTLSPAVSAVKVADKPFHLDYDQSSILMLITLLVKHCRLPSWPDNALPASYLPSIVPPLIMQPQTHALLTSTSFLSRLAHAPTIKSNITHTELACHLCWLDIRTSFAHLQQLLSCIEHHDANQVWPALCQLQGLLTLGDNEQLMAQRVELTLPTLLNIFAANQSFYRLTDLCLRFLFSLQTAQPLLATCLHAHLPLLDWVPGWLSVVKKPPTRTQPIFCDDGRVVQLNRDMDDKEQGREGPWDYRALGDLSKVYKTIVEESKKSKAAS